LKAKTALFLAKGVSAVVPMRRELKELWDVRNKAKGTSFSSCPDEEGTERG